MTASGGQRVYLDWNATAPLRPEARAAMLAAMDAVGNPSSVHAEGRAARAIVEKARGQVAALVGCEPGEVVFTSGATEAIDLRSAKARRLRGHATTTVFSRTRAPTSPDSGAAGGPRSRTIDRTCLMPGVLPALKLSGRRR